MQESALMVLLRERGTGFTTLFVEGLVKRADIGVLDHERGVLQRLRFDVEVHIKGASAPVEDRIDAVLDYDSIEASIDRLLSGPRSELLETLCSHLLDSLLSSPEVTAASVSIAKMDVLDGDASVGCRMTRFVDHVTV